MADQYNVRLDIQFETIKGLKTALAEANKELENAKINTVEWTNAFKKVGDLKMQMAGVTTAMRQTVVATQQTSQASANAGMALLNLNYVIRDSPYFFNNFALGVLAVGNNLNPLIDSFARLRKEALEKNLTTVGLLRQALVGGAGLSIAFSVVVTAIQAFVFWQAKAGKESGETAKEVDLLTEALKRFVDVNMPSGKTMFSIKPEDLKKVIAETQKQLDDVGASLDAIAMKKSYGSNTWNDNTEKATKEATKEKEELEKIKKVLEENLEVYKKELRAREILSKLGIDEVARQKEKTKELKKQVDYLRDQAHAIETSRAMGFGREAGVRPSNTPYLGIPYAEPDRKEVAEGKRMKDSIKEFQVHLEMGKILANELGNALNQAFMKGKFALDEFIKSLISAITQMLILRTITNFLTFGLAGGANAVTPLPTVIPKSGLSKQGVVRVTGKITADKNNFIANIRNADNYYKRNEEFVLVGR